MDTDEDRLLYPPMAFGHSSNSREHTTRPNIMIIYKASVELVFPESIDDKLLVNDLARKQTAAGIQTAAGKQTAAWKQTANFDLFFIVRCRLFRCLARISSCRQRLILQSRVCRWCMQPDAECSCCMQTLHADVACRRCVLIRAARFCYTNSIRLSSFPEHGLQRCKQTLDTSHNSYM